jgi:hypothetical protein
MRNIASEITRELPADPIVFGALAFGIFVLLLYVVLRLDK